MLYYASSGVCMSQRYSTQFKNRRILLIDDDRVFLLLLKQVFSPYGYEIDTVTNYEEAVQNFRDSDYALVLVDFHLSGSIENGLTIIRQFKKFKPEPEIIMITANPSLELAVEAFEAGIYDFLTKPTNMHKVKQCIERALEKYELTCKQKQLHEDLVTKNQELQETNSKLLTALEDARTFQAYLASSKKLAGIGEMTASVAHEFNNILGAIRGFSQLALRNPERSDYLLELHEKIKKAVDRAIDVVGNLLICSRRVKPEKEVGDIHEAIRETISLAENHLHLKKIELITEFGKIPAFKFDVGQLQQVFLNLITNSAQAVEEGGTITIRSSKKGSKAILEFSDSGCGIPPDLLDKIFVPFFTTKTRASTEDASEIGSGLGLFVSRRIIESHRGYLRVESNVNTGTTFRIALPIDGAVPEGVEATKNLEKANPPVKTDDFFPKGKALIVDDEADIRSILRKFLEDKGFQTREACNGEECLEVLKEDSDFQVIFMDLMMPRVNGEMALQVIREEYPEPRVLVMSGFGGGVSGKSPQELGAHRYIPKPFDLDDLERVLAEELSPGGEDEPV
jgi:signal transduction histidine kinase